MLHGRRDELKFGEGHGERVVRVGGRHGEFWKVGTLGVGKGGECVQDRVGGSVQAGECRGRGVAVEAWARGVWDRGWVEIDRV